MAFVYQAERFLTPSADKSSPGPGEYIQMAESNMTEDELAQYRYKKAPFGSNASKQYSKSLSVHRKRPDKPLFELEVPHITSSFVVPSGNFISEAERFSDPNSTKVPGPGSYSIPSFSDKLKEKINAKIISQEIFKEIKEQRTKSTDKGCFQITTYKKSKPSPCVNPVESINWCSLGSVPPTTDLMVDPVLKDIPNTLKPLDQPPRNNNSTEDKSSNKSPLFTSINHNSVEKSLQNSKGAVKWKFENAHSDRFDHLVNKNVGEPLLYQPIWDEESQTSKGPSSVFKSKTKKNTDPIRYFWIIDSGNTKI